MGKYFPEDEEAAHVVRLGLRGRAKPHRWFWKYIDRAQRRVDADGVEFRLGKPIVSTSLAESEAGIMDVVPSPVASR